MTDKPMHSKAIEAAARAAYERAPVFNVRKLRKPFPNHEMPEWEPLAWDEVAESYREGLTSFLAAYLANREAEGFVMVPVEPTEAMIDAGFDHHPKHFEAQMGRPPTPEEDMDWQYRAMLSARPNGEG